MSETTHQPGYRLYWITWFALLVLTVVMIFVGYAAIPRMAIITLLLAFMVVKLVLIGGYFMHLRYERLSLILTIVVSILFVAACLYALIAIDGMRILNLSSG
jgi:cytochrome c oxidase subunit IV